VSELARKIPQRLQKKGRFNLVEAKVERDRLMVADRLYIPGDASLKLRILRLAHDSIPGGHGGRGQPSTHSYALIFGRACWKTWLVMWAIVICANAPSIRERGIKVCSDRCQSLNDRDRMSPLTTSLGCRSPGMRVRTTSIFLSLWTGSRR
jgi:hypothetical protein